MKKSYDDELAKVVGKIERLTTELLSRPDRHLETVMDRYLKKMDRLKKKLLEIKTQHFLEGGLYQ